MHKWEDLRPEEFYEEFNRMPVAYIAFGAMEDHGLQNALGVDPLSAYEYCLRTAEVTGGIVHPYIPLAPAYNPPLSHEQLRSGEFELFPPSLWVSVELCERAYMEVFESLAGIGFKLCVAFGGHGPAITLLKQMAKNCRNRVGDMKLFSCGPLEYVSDMAKQDPDGEKRYSMHGGRWETSVNMALNPDYVDLSRVRDIDASPIPSQLKNSPEEMLRRIETANAEFGERIIRVVSEQLAEKVKELLAEA